MKEIHKEKKGAYEGPEREVGKARKKRNDRKMTEKKINLVCGRVTAREKKAKHTECLDTCAH